jgi:hypothetical protein
MAGEDEFISLSQAETTLLQLPLHLSQNDALLRFREPSYPLNIAIMFNGLKK